MKKQNEKYNEKAKHENLESKNNNDCIISTEQNEKQRVNNKVSKQQAKNKIHRL